MMNCIDYDAIVRTAYDNMKSRLPATTLDERCLHFYDKLEACIQMIYDPYYDKDELHKAIKKFKTQKGCEQLDSRLFMLQAKILSARVDKNVRKIFDKAGTFRPRRNEPIDKDGDCYWRTMRDGRKICFKKGENVREKLMEWWQSRDWKKEGRLARVKKGQHKKSEESLKQKAQENEKIEHKLCDGHNQLLSGLIYRKLDRDRLKN